MRRKFITLTLIILSILIMALAACSSKKAEKNTGETMEGAINGVEEQEAPEEYTRDDIMKDFKKILDSKNEPQTLIKFIDENINKVEKQAAVEMIMGLEDIQVEHTDIYTDEMFAEGYQGELLGLWEETADFDSPSSLFLDITSIIDEVENENLKDLLERLLAGKYKLITMEGSFYPIIDYEALKEYNKYLNDEVKSYLDIKSMEANEPTVLDAAFHISFDQLADRLIKVEKHITTFSEDIRGEELLRLYGAYLKLYLGGVDNTPIYEYETETVKKEVLDSYKKTAKVQDSITGAIVNKYKEIIEENDNIIDNGVLSKITECHNEAIAKLEEGR